MSQPGRLIDEKAGSGTLGAPTRPGGRERQWANETATGVSGGLSDTVAINWTGAITGKVGVAFDSVMPYLLGGVAFENDTVSYFNGATTSSESANWTGWVVGAGVAVKVADNLSIFGEYRYADYGSHDYATPGDNGVRLTDSSFRAGVNLHFN